MRLSLQTVFLLMLATMLFAAPAMIPIGNFAGSGLAGWTEKSFKGENEYLIVEESGQKVLRATSRATASGLVYNVDYAARDYPVLTWRWKISGTIASGDGRTRAGDDYAARIYVVFPHWFFPKTRTLNYIWANKLAKETILPNAFTANAMMIAVESGDDNAGRWIEIRRDIVEDYRRAFGEEPPQVGAIALMTDTDNTGESAIAWYSDIVARQQ